MSTEIQYLVVTDLETSGVRSAEHEILQIARVTIDLNGPTVLGNTLWSTYIKPTNWRRRDPAAMAVNGLTREFLDQKGVSLKEALIAYSTGVPWNNAQLTAWGADFEKSFLEAAFKTVDRACPINFRAECIRSWAHLHELRSKSQALLNLEEACLAAGLAFDHNSAHNAEYDALQTAHLAVSLIGA